MKKILTLEDLYRVFEEKHLTHFNAEESGFRIVVSTPGQFELEGTDNEGSSLSRSKPVIRGLTATTPIFRRKLWSEPSPLLRTDPSWVTLSNWMMAVTTFSRTTLRSTRKTGRSRLPGNPNWRNLGYRECSFGA